MDLVNVVFVMDLSGIVTHRVFKFYDYNWLYAASIHIDSLKSLGLLLKGLPLKVAILSKNFKHSQNIQTTIKHTKQKNKNEKQTHNLQKKNKQKIHNPNMFQTKSTGSKQIQEVHRSFTY